MKIYKLSSTYKTVIIYVSDESGRLTHTIRRHCVNSLTRLERYNECKKLLVEHGFTPPKYHDKVYTETRAV